MTTHANSTMRAFALGAAISAIVGSMGSLSAYGQATTSGGGKIPLDLAVTYQAVRQSNATSGSSFFMQGGAIEFGARLRHGFGVVASVTGEHAGAGTTGASPIDIVVVAAGPRYTLAPTKHTALFAEALVGGASAFHSVFPGNSGSTQTPGNGATSSANSLALLVGGGIDLKINSRFSIRAIQADWQRTQLPNSRDNIQNGLRIGAGVVVKWGRS